MEEKMGFSPSTTAPRRVAFSEKQSHHRISSADSAPPLFTHYEGIDRCSSSTIERNRLWTQQEEPDLEKNHEYAKKKSRSFPCHKPDRRNFDSGGDSSGGRKNVDSSSRSSSWSSWGSLHNRVKENIQNSWHLGFLWPDEEDGLEFLEQDRKSTCCEHDDDDEDHDLIHSQQKQEQQQQQQQQHEETDSLLQNSSTKFGGFASPNYGTWLSSTPTDQQFNMRGGTPRFALGSLQAYHSHTPEEHESSPSAFSNILDKTSGIMKHSQSVPSFVVADEEEDDNTTATQETNGTRTTPSDDDFDLRIHVPGRSGWDNTEIDKLPSSLQYPSSTRAFPSTPKSAKISTLTPTKSMPAARHGVKVVKKKKKCLHRCNTAPAMSAPARAAATAKNADDNNNSDVVKRPHLSKSGSIMMQAGLGLMVYLAVGVLIYTWKRKEFSGSETVSYVDALYFCIVTMCTIGYGDITPITTSAKLFACGFVLIGFGFIDALLSGMVNYVLNKQEHLLLSAVEGSHYQVARRYFMNPNHGNRMRIRMKVALAAGVPVWCIIVGTIVMMQMEKLSWIDALYCTIMSITTVGYGDHTFKSFTGRLFAAVWLLFSTLAVARCFLYLAEARVEKRHRAIAKWVLRRQFSVGDLIKADLDHDGCISKSEYVVYKLKEMGNVHDEQIHDICLQFDQLDSHNTGKITLARLQEGN